MNNKKNPATNAASPQTYKPEPEEEARQQAHIILDLRSHITTLETENAELQKELDEANTTIINMKDELLKLYRGLDELHESLTNALSVKSDGKDNE